VDCVEVVKTVENVTFSVFITSSTNPTNDSQNSFPDSVRISCSVILCDEVLEVGVVVKFVSKVVELLFVEVFKPAVVKLVLLCTEFEVVDAIEVVVPEVIELFAVVNVLEVVDAFVVVVVL